MKKLGLMVFICGLVLAVSATAKATVILTEFNVWVFDFEDPGDKANGIMDISVYWSLRNINTLGFRFESSYEFLTFTFDVSNNNGNPYTINDGTVQFVQSALETGFRLEGEFGVSGNLPYNITYTGMEMTGQSQGGGGSQGTGSSVPLLLIGTTGGPFNGTVTYYPSAVPEPGTLLLLGSGLLGLLSYSKFRSRRSKRK